MNKITFDFSNNKAEVIGDVSLSDALLAITAFIDCTLKYAQPKTDSSYEDLLDGILFIITKQIHEAGKTNPTEDGTNE